MALYFSFMILAEMSIIWSMVFFSLFIKYSLHLIWTNFSFSPLSDALVSGWFYASILNMKELRSSNGMSMIFFILLKASKSMTYSDKCIAEQSLSYFFRNFISKNDDDTRFCTVTSFLKSQWQAFFLFGYFSAYESFIGISLTWLINC